MRWTAAIGFVLVFCLGAVTGAQALEESTVFDTIKTRIAQDAACDGSEEPFWHRQSITNPDDGYRVRYSRFGCTVGANGAIVISPGRTESSVEYYETALDFIALGYGPVYAVDHRGQGLSPRLLPDLSKGHVEAFEDYVADFAIVVDAVRAELAELNSGREPPLFFISNSMGGAIGLGYFQAAGTDNPFTAAALSGPMIRVNYISFVDRPLSWLNLGIYSEFGALVQANWRCSIVWLWDGTRCNDYASPATFGAYRADTREFLPDTERIMTHSRARYDLRTYLWDGIDWPAITRGEYTSDELWVGPHLGGSTNGWVQATARFNRDMRKAKNLKKAQVMPIMILMGTRDLRGYRPYRSGSGRKPDLSHAKGLCDDLNAISAREGRYICEFVALEGGFHELLKESDPYRDKAMATVHWFFQQH